jgi:hydrogenase maturation protein HypF
MMNRILAEGLMAELTGIAPVIPRRIPPNDGGLSLGQAVLARCASIEGG